ncbi:hypothetical protein SLS63_006467 [Diaporthe eres]|uniref:linoleate 8R-lipoxygenase n=1 Tax=Diaporthe eres TaxID=83184 RepID=A0ABR1P895_DIAER
MSSPADSRLSSLIETVRASLAPLDKSSSAPGNDDNVSQTGLIEDIQALGFKDYGTLVQFLNASVTGTNDDNHLLLERLVQLLAKLPPHSKQMKGLSDGFINQLWTTLDHPPVSSLGDQYKYRRADGSYNNIYSPQLGAANTPYARSVKPAVFQNPDLPEPDIVFERLSISSMLFYLATIIIHDIFQTSHTDYNVNLASSYLDLSPLYGRNVDEVKMMRTFQDGLLKPDCFSSARILGFPPGCGVFLCMFNRFHNYVATQLALINEAGRFNKPNTGDKAAWAKYDEDLFQTSRLVTCGLYVNIILKDYVRTILALNRTNSSWSLDPRTKEGKDLFSKPVPEGVGNQVSAEFNLIYRWHSTISLRDEQWSIAEMKRILKDKDPETASVEDVLRALGEWQAGIPSQPEARTFENLTRLPDGTFPDDEIAKILTESIEDVAGSYGANRVPRCMKAIEMLGIIQARHWNMGTLNEFREFVGLTKHASFEDINPDPDVAAHLKQLYDHPDSVEMYPGIVAEKAKPPITPGSGLCGNVTMTTAILSDAVALVRGDRFYTVDYTPKALTNWGFNEANYDTAVDGGQVLHKLIFRAFPNHFVNNSIYAHFPLVTPSENKKIHESLGTRSQYSWETPRAHKPPVMIRSYKACTQILNDNTNFKVMWGEAITYLTTQNDDAPGVSADFCLSGDRNANRSNRVYIQKCLYPNKWEDDVKAFFATTSARLLKENGYSVPESPEGRTYEVDIVGDVISLATTHFSAALWSLPIKTEAHPHGIYTEHQLYNVLLAGFAAIFFDADIANSYKLRSQARVLAQQLGKLMAVKAKLLDTGDGIVAAVLDTVKESIAAIGHIINGNGAGKANPSQEPEWPALALYGERMIKRMLGESRATPEDVVWGSVLPASVAACANQTQVLSQAIDYYLGDGKEHLPAMYALAQHHTEDANEKLKKYMLEGVRLRGEVAVTRAVVTDQVVRDFSPSQPDPSDPGGLNPLPNANPGGSGTTHELKAGTRLLLDLTAANHDGTVFPEPETVRLDRPIKSYIHFGWGPHLCLGQDMSISGLAVVFKKIVGLKNLRRAPGRKGEVKSFPAAFWNGQVGSIRNPDVGWTGLRTYMTADQSSFWPLPSTLKVQWDE